ncbi:alpha-glycosidase [Anoxybacter fermentans]|uniref:Alpha-glycosidase n=1 Tax=Anoxybacter fermentans TaxID=1323375 RepID=A0A3S9SVB5_9FIRM|nr:glycoside hydrolase family 13 protein [Anoxybacter fermentans]AZR72218.1 alpha-glycosidase [Anoxybacter fermentans]
MLREAIFHQAGGAYAYPIAKDTLMIQLRAAKDDLKVVYLIYGDRYCGTDPVDRVIMEKYASDQLFDYYRAKVQIKTRTFRYIFLLDDGKERYWYNEFGFSKCRPLGYHSGYFQYPYIAERDFFEIPDWVQDAVVYSIFPDRFFNGDKTNDPTTVREWGEKPTSQMDLYGGDLAGVLAKLPYLEKLGVNTLYLTPIFKSPTSHKYDTTDYFEIDPHFGDKELFRKLINECHKRGMRVILDAVFNHCGYEFAPFQDVIKNGTKSKYWDWFYIKDYPITTDPVNYETFARNVWRMPKLRHANPEVKEYLLQVGEYWVREFDIDGWRLDVANEIDHAFWREFRTRLRAIKPDLYIIGEVWHHAGAYLLGDQFDAVMNYPFREAVIGFFGERTLSVDAFDERLTINRVTYPKQAVDAAWNLLGSHDTERILTRFKGNKKALKLAVTFQMTYQGVPFIYYGDEIGLEGGNDPDCRRCMPWDEEEQDLNLFNHYRKLIQIRRKYEALRKGEFRTIYKDEATGIYIFERYTENERVLVIINNGLKEEEVKIDLKSLGFDPTKTVQELLRNEIIKTEDGLLNLTVEAVEAAILVQ